MNKVHIVMDEHGRVRGIFERKWRAELLLDEKWTMFSVSLCDSKAKVMCDSPSESMRNLRENESLFPVIAGFSK